MRVIAATNRNLQDEVANGNFRADLFYRISVFQIELPPLRERIAGIEELVKHFLVIFAQKTNKRITGITAEALEALKKHQWKGNIRELKNVVERAVILCNSHEIGMDQLPLEFQTGGMAGHTKYLSAFDLSSVEKPQLLQLQRRQILLQIRLSRR